MTDNEKFRLKVVDDLRKNRVIVESDEDYIKLLKKANKDLGDLVRERDKRVSELEKERDALKQAYESAENSVLALKEIRNRVTAERDALKQQRDELVICAELLIRAMAGTQAETDFAFLMFMLEDAIASVKEK